jgi:hypothetical protein
VGKSLLLMLFSKAVACALQHDAQTARAYAMAHESSAC